MEDEKQLFKDKSEDRKYLTITPNIIINGYSAIESGVYTYIKKRAGENGQFFETAFNTAKTLKISKPTYLKIRNTLEKDNRIKFVGWKKGKTHPIKIYEIVDIWKENINQYENKRKVKNTTTSQKERSKILPLERSKIDTQKKNPLEEEPTILATPAVVARKDQVIFDLIELFKPINPTYRRLFGNTTQRASLERLVKQFGREKIENMIKYLPKIFGKPYAPRITTPYLLEQKLADLIAYTKQEQSKGPKVFKLR